MTSSSSKTNIVMQIMKTNVTSWNLPLFTKNDCKNHPKNKNLHECENQPTTYQLGTLWSCNYLLGANLLVHKNLKFF
jgi:hypothetical protein